MKCVICNQSHQDEYIKLECGCKEMIIHRYCIDEQINSSNTEIKCYRCKKDINLYKYITIEYNNFSDAKKIITDKNIWNKEIKITMNNMKKIDQTNGK